MDDVHRLAVVLSAQCENMRELGFLPARTWRAGQPVEAGRDLPALIYEQLTDPGGGSCQPVPGLDGIEGIQLADIALVVNPTLGVAKAVLQHSLTEADEAEASLVVHYVGHGRSYEDTDGRPHHLLQVLDTAEQPFGEDDPYHGWDPYTWINNHRRDYPQLTGLVLLVDACEASTASVDVRLWIDKRASFPFMWFASSRDANAYDGCFTETLTGLIRSGISREAHPRHDVVTELSSRDVGPAISESCRRQEPTALTGQEYNRVLFIAKNRAAERARVELGLDAPAAQRISGLLASYQSVQAGDILRETEGHRLCVVVGEAGTGKSTVASALRMQPDESEFTFPVEALAFLSQATGRDEVARDLSPQLATLERYRVALRAFERAHAADIDQLPDSVKLLLGPLEVYAQPLTIVLDGWDQLGEETKANVETLIQELISMPHVSLIMTSRPGVAYPPGAHQIEIPPMTTEIASRYLSAVGIPSDRHEALVTIAGERWLVLSLAAAFSKRSPDAVPTDLTALYRTMIEGATGRHGWEAVGPILTTFAATVGPGPVLPFSLLAHAVRSLGGPETRSDVESVLADQDLHALIERSSPSSRDEHIGVFHWTLIQELGQHPDIDAVAGHAALLDAIDEIAPPESEPEGSKPEP
jgi:NACHT domain